jgi:TIR domain-containing protein
MNSLQRLELIDRIGRELQSRMSFADIPVYLEGTGVSTNKETSGVNSKWVYVKELLADEPTNKIVAIATELEIPHTYTVVEGERAVEATFWLPFHFRLFLSHLSGSKVTAARLQDCLAQLGISAFVAHVDIEPTREWQDEIELGLCSMDALAAILVPGFRESQWTDQEVGFAMGRGVQVIPIIHGLLPYGFISKYQGIKVSGRTVSAVANAVVQALLVSPKTKNKYLTCLVDTSIQATNPAEVVDRLSVLEEVEELSKSHLERLREGAAKSASFEGDSLERLNALLARYGMSNVPNEVDLGFGNHDECPF